MLVNYSKLKELRQARRTSVRQFAEIFGLCPKTVWKIERGVCGIRAANLRKIARFYHVEVSELAVVPQGNKLRTLRIAKGLTQKELGEKIYCGDTTISAWELGRHRPDYELLAKFFEVPVEELKC